jgi:EpsI family protein
MSRLRAWVPATILAGGVLLMQGAGRQQRMELRRSLDESIPRRLADMAGRDTTLSMEEVQAVGMTSYVLRRYGRDLETAGADFSLYVGYYDSQAQGRTIHSPKNCLPGAGWEPLRSGTTLVSTVDGPVKVNRYLIQNGTSRAIVLYWYQGRGRVAASEYAVNWDLLRDAAIRRRTEEALVRVAVPITDEVGSEDEAFDLAARVAGSVIPSVFRALPEA